MSLLFTDSVQYPTADVPNYWSTLYNPTRNAVATSANIRGQVTKRHHSLAGWTTIVTTGGLGYAPPTALTTTYFGCAMRFNSTTWPTTFIQLAVFNGGASNYIQSGILVSSSGELLFVRNSTALSTFISSTGQLISSGYFIPLNTWFHLQAKVTISDAIPAGGVVLYINEQPVLTAPTGMQTTFQTAGANRGPTSLLYLGSLHLQSSTVDICDFWVTDDQLLGDVVIDPHTMTANGDINNWTPNAGANYAAINEALSDGATSYIESNTPGDRDYFTHQALKSGPTTIKGINPITVARKTDVGARTLKSSLRIAGTNYDQANAQILLDSYRYFQNPLALNPATTTAWTESTFNAAQVGVKVEA